MSGKYLLTTLGCKVNQYESQQLREILESFGLRHVKPGEAADVAIVNTCAVTEAAISKNHQTIRRAANGGRTAIVVVGCGATADAQRLKALDGVTAVWGHESDVRSELGKLLAQRLVTSTPVSVNEISNDHAVVGRSSGARRDEVRMKPVEFRHPGEASAGGHSFTSEEIVPVSLPVVKSDDTLIGRIESFHGHQRAFLKVQDGCDAFCTYCIIPQLRPTPRFKPIESAVEEARTLVLAEHKEIILTGIFLGAYGRRTAVRKRFTTRRSPLSALVKAIAEVDGLQRLRLSSLEPGDVDGSLLEVLTAYPCCVPHLHLPLQSGSERILRRMNRQYTRDAYLDMIERVRRAFDRPAISTDVIVGFPGETDDDFEASVEVARHAEFCKIHAFRFSARDGTAAARWRSEFISPAVVRERMRRLAEVERECSLAYRRQLLRMTERVIVERSDDRSGDSGVAGIRHGRADRYIDVHFDSDGSIRTGDLVDVRIDRITPTRTHGTYVSPCVGDYRLPVLAHSA